MDENAVSPAQVSCLLSVLRSAMTHSAPLLDHDALELERRSRCRSVSREAGGIGWEERFVGRTSWIYYDRIASSRDHSIDFRVCLRLCEAGESFILIDNVDQLKPIYLEHLRLFKESMRTVSSRLHAPAA